MFVLGNLSIIPSIFSYIFLGIFCASMIFAALYSRNFRTYLRSTSSKKGNFGNIFLGILLLFMSGCFFIALSNPEWKNTTERNIQSGNTIIFALDVSKSMLAEDLKPNRIESAKKILKKFVQQGNIAQMGLVIFAGEAFTSIPPTSDTNAFLSVLDVISPTSIRQELPGLSGTSIGNALLLSEDLLRRNSIIDHKAIILLTDGEANTGMNPIPIIKNMAQGNTPIYSVGIGSESGTDLYVTAQDGTKKYFLGEDGKPIRAILDEWLLRFASESTKGEYFRASDEKGLQEIFTSLEKLSEGKTEKIPVTKTIPLENIFAMLLCISCVPLFILRYILGESSLF